MSLEGQDSEFLLNIHKVENLCLQLQNDRPATLRKFAQFEQQRKKSILLVAELQEKLQNLCVAVDCTKAVGNAVNFASEVTAVAGFVATVLGHKDLGQTLFEASESGTMVGYATICAASLVEMGVSQYFINHLKTTLQDDATLQNRVQLFNTRITDLNSYFKQIFGFELQSRMCRDGFQIWNHFLKFMDQCRSVDYSHIMNRLVKAFKHSRNTLELLKTLDYTLNQVFKLIHKNGKLLKTLQDICAIVQSNSNLLFSAKFVKELFVERMSKGFRALTVSYDNALARGSFNAIQAAMSFTCLMENVKDIKERKHFYYNQLEEIKASLEHELNIVSTYIEQSEVKPAITF